MHLQMGLVTSKTGGESAETTKSKALDTKLDLVAEDESRRIRVLVLGLPRSGKSTIMKSFRAIELGASKCYNTAQRKAAVADVHEMILRSMQTLIRQAHERGLDPLPTHVQTVLNADTRLTVMAASAINQLWSADPAIQAAYGLRNHFPLLDSAPHFFSKVMAVVSPDYLPDNADMLRVKSRAYGYSERPGMAPPRTRPTTGLFEDPFFTDAGEFSFIDGGAQAGDPKKWMPSFTGVMAVIFVASLADYDCPSDGQPAVNRLQEAMLAFAEAVNSPYFDNAAFALVLNKADLFQGKISATDLRYTAPASDRDLTASATAAVMSNSRLAPMASTAALSSYKSSPKSQAPPALDVLPSRFLDYAGGTSYFQALKYLQDRFLELSRRPADRPVHTFVTTALDDSVMGPVVQSMKTTFAEHAVERGGDKDA